MPKAFLDSCASQGSIPLGNYTHILDSGVVEGALVGRSNLPCRREICEGESHTKLSREAVLDVYLTSVPSWSYDGSQRLGSNWIWLQEPVNLCPWIRQEPCAYTSRLLISSLGTIYPANSRGFRLNYTRIRCRSLIYGGRQPSPRSQITHQLLSTLPHEVWYYINASPW